jgi:hypothetical protein
MILLCCALFVIYLFIIYYFAIYYLLFTRLVFEQKKETKEFLGLMRLESELFPNGHNKENPHMNMVYHWENPAPWQACQNPHMGRILGIGMLDMLRLRSPPWRR